MSFTNPGENCDKFLSPFKFRSIPIFSYIVLSRQVTFFYRSWQVISRIFSFNSFFAELFPFLAHCCVSNVSSGSHFFYVFYPRFYR